MRTCAGFFALAERAFEISSFVDSPTNANSRPVASIMRKTCPLNADRLGGSSRRRAARRRERAKRRSISARFFQLGAPLTTTPDPTPFLPPETLGRRGCGRVVGVPPFDVRGVQRRLAAATGGYEIVHEARGVRVRG